MPLGSALVPSLSKTIGKSFLGLTKMSSGALIGGAVGGISSDSATSTGVFNDALQGAAIGAGIGFLGTGTAKFLGRQALRTPQAIRATAGAFKEGAGPLEALSYGAWESRAGAPGFTKRFSSFFKEARSGALGEKEGVLSSASFALQMARHPLKKKFARKALRSNLKEIGSIGWGIGTGLGGAAIRTGASILTNPHAGIAAVGIGVGMYGLANSGRGNAGSSSKGMAAVAQSQGLPSSGFEPGMGAGRNQGDRFAFENSTQGLVQGLHRGRH